MMRNVVGSAGAGVRIVAGCVTATRLRAAGRAVCGLAVCGLIACGDAERPLPDDLSRDLSLAATARADAPLATVGGDTASGTGARASSAPATPPPAAARTPDAAAPRAASAPAPASPAAPPRPPAEPPRAEATTAGAGAAAADSAAAGADARGATPAGRERRTLLGAGATLVGTTGARICSSSNRPGDRLVMRLRDPVTGVDGTVLAAGTAVLLEVARADSVLVLRVRSVQHDGELLPLVATATAETPLVATTTGGGVDKKKVIGGAIAGAIIGQVLGKDTRGTVIGAAGGAAAGAAAGRRTGVAERCLPEGATVRVVLDQPLLTPGIGP